MTTTSSEDATTGRRSLLPYAVAAFLLGAALTAVGTFLDVIGDDTGDEGDELGTWLAVLAVLAVITFVVYRFWYERAAAAPIAPNSALVGGILAAVTVLVFWSGLPSVFAVGALVLGSKGGGVKAQAGMVLAVAAIAVSIWAALAG